MRRATLFWAVVVLVLLGMFALQVTSIRGETQTVDEGAHLAAGYSYWKTGDFRLNPEHPPLVKLLASVPLLFLPIHLPVDEANWAARDEWAFARQLLYHNTVPAETILFWGRLPVMLLALGLGLLIAVWARKLWGFTGGLLALTLFAFDPTVLAHSRYVTTDIGVTFFFFGTVYFFGKFLDRPNAKRWWPVVLFFALAQTAKFSAVILWAVLAVLWILRTITDEGRRELGWRKALLFFLSLLIATNLTAFIMYGFEIKAPLKDPQFEQIYSDGSIWQPPLVAEQPGLARTVLRITDPATPFGRALRATFASVPLPAYTYFRGLSSVVWHNYWGHSSYLLGDFRSKGWWYYFPVAFLVKTPLATLILFLLALLYIARLFVNRFFTYRRRPELSRWSALLLSYRSGDFQYALLLVPPLIYFTTSLTSHINLGVRHLLPIYPFLFVLAGNLVTARFRRWQWAWNASLATIVALFLLSSALIYPHYLSYYSELVGGPNQGARFMTDSNLDWGQELGRLGSYLDQRGIPFVYITYFGQAPMERYLKDFRYLPSSQEPQKIAALDGWAAISATALFDPSGKYNWLRALHPSAKIGYAIFLYDLRKTP